MQNSCIIFRFLQLQGFQTLKRIQTSLNQLNDYCRFIHAKSSKSRTICP